MASISDSEHQRGGRGITDDAMLCARLEDAVRLCERRHAPCFVGFLDERQRGTAEDRLRSQTLPYMVYGGYPEAERTMAGLFPSYMEPDPSCFPLVSIAFSYRKDASLSHRDFLGTLLACGVKREKIGDILCSPGLTVAFVEEELAPYLSAQIEKVGGEGVSILAAYDGELPAVRVFREIRGSVASPRLDAVVKTLLGISREDASRRIEAGLVALNHVPCVSVCTQVREGDRLSIRGEGRFLVDALGPVNRKGRLTLTGRKYV